MLLASIVASALLSERCCYFDFALIVKVIVVGLVTLIDFTPVGNPGPGKYAA